MIWIIWVSFLRLPLIFIFNEIAYIFLIYLLNIWPLAAPTFRSIPPAWPFNAILSRRPPVNTSLVRIISWLFLFWFVFTWHVPIDQVVVYFWHSKNLYWFTSFWRHWYSWFSQILIQCWIIKINISTTLNEFLDLFLWYHFM